MRPGAKQSIRTKILIPMAFVLVLQALLFFGTIVGADTAGQLRENAFSMLADKVSSRAAVLENEMTQRWGKAENYQRVMQLSLAAYQQAEGGEVQITRQMAEELISLLRNSTATGAYVIFCPQLGEGAPWPALYLRDMDPTTSLINNTDILVEIGPGPLIKEMGLTMDSRWSPSIQLDPMDENQRYFFRPYLAAQQYQSSQISDLGYWAGPHQVTKDDLEVISYSLPLLDRDGQVYGVVGVEITLEYLANQMPYRELSANQKGAYLLGLREGQGNEVLAMGESGPLFRRILADDRKVAITEEKVYKDTYRLEDQALTSETVGAVQKLKLYNAHTPFEEEEWMVIGLMEEQELLYSVNRLNQSLWFASLIALGVGVAGAFVISASFAAPVKRLAKSLRESDPAKEVLLPQTGIVEIDGLSTAVEELSAAVANSASRLSQILEYTNTSLGAVEYYKERGGLVYCTGKIGEMLDFSPENREKSELPYDEFQQELERMKKKILAKTGRQEQDKVVKDILELHRDDGRICWISFKHNEGESRYMVVVQDVTGDVLEKRKIEYERDYDVLTELLNRRSFRRSVEKALRSMPFQMGAMVMWDLDNLKYINDTYGHDSGDKYIIAAARVFQQLRQDGAEVARMSGDEFFSFLPGEDRNTLLCRIREVHKLLHSTNFQLPDGKTVKLRASAGVAWYPDNGASYDLLIKYADFAMYSAKNSTKGDIQEFNQDAFQRDELLFSGKEALNHFLDHRLARFAFQPIVDARTGEVYAYEALMRPSCEGLKTVSDVMRLVRAQSKLNQIEELTWTGALEAFSQQKEAFGEARLFINSVPNTCLSKEGFAALEQQFGKDLSRLVVEVIESEQTDYNCMAIKQSLCQRWGLSIALDDFGAGYSSEGVLLTINPSYVKIDMSIVRGIDRDKSRQTLLGGILSYSKTQDIRIIAEGVETREEMVYLIEAGVDYIQGYYLAVPDFRVRGIPQERKQEIQEAAGRVALPPIDL
ncbi:EAL domain-containing protein [Merdimmobilis hominis]|uniref:EAL domain-containing protein n=1 Tax=Merdimmobilis hominis TaxID=2897707 RepID=UPI003513B442